VASRETERRAHAIDGIDTRPLRQQIADSLQRAILDGELKPGSPLIEMDIAQRLGVSRAPVREALQLLARANLVETAPYRGTTVRLLTPTDVEEVYSLRSVLETFALRRGLARDRSGLARVLRSSCDAMQSIAADGDWSRLAVEDARFHELLVAHADHAMLQQVWRDLHMRVRQIMALRNLQNDDSMEVYYRHVPIVDAIEADDVGAAVAALEAHIASAADLVLDHAEAGSAAPAFD
jgi:DNA-binding GntR family transcriptional regulator